MINKKIIELLKKLNLKCYFMEAPLNAGSKYVLFNTYKEKDTDVFDNKSTSTTHFIQLNYWYKNSGDMVLYQTIKELMKENGFKFDGCRDLKDGDYYCKAFDFIYKERL